MAFLGTTRLLISEKAATYTVSYVNKYQKIPIYMPLSRPTRLLISEKTSHLHTWLLGSHAY